VRRNTDPFVVDDDVAGVNDVRRCALERHSVVDVDVGATELRLGGRRVSSRRVPDNEVGVTTDRDATLSAESRKDGNDERMQDVLNEFLFTTAQPSFLERFFSNGVFYGKRPAYTICSRMNGNQPSQTDCVMQKHLLRFPLKQKNFESRSYCTV